MGNRAVIFEQGKTKGVYQHWNGGRDSVEAFLQYCRLTKKTGGFQYEYRRKENGVYGKSQRN